jgi:hypothetical protein
MNKAIRKRKIEKLNLKGEKRLVEIICKLNRLNE